MNDSKARNLIGNEYRIDGKCYKAIAYTESDSLVLENEQGEIRTIPWENLE